jgi:hypothetical protein
MDHPDMHPISFTYPPVASMWVVTIHNLFLYSDPPLPFHPPSYGLRLFSSLTFSHINNPTFLKPSHTSYLPAYEDGTECSEMSTYTIQTLGNYPRKHTNCTILHIAKIGSILNYDLHKCNYIEFIYNHHIHPFIKLWLMVITKIIWTLEVKIKKWNKLGTCNIMKPLWKLRYVLEILVLY